VDSPDVLVAIIIKFSKSPILLCSIFTPVYFYLQKFSNLSDTKIGWPEKGIKTSHPFDVRPS
jgi:hypothetical protein